jgi:prolyl-tRNA synthetase
VKNGEEEHVWATSWGVSTRLIGAVIMTHSDDTGLVLPPKLAPIQIAIVPIWRKEKEREEVLSFAKQVQAQLKRTFRVTLDDREGLKPGAKYFEWEKKGVPLRMEIGPRDVVKNSVFCAKRTGGKKFGLPVDEQFTTHAQVLLESIQQELLDRATAYRDAQTYTISTYKELTDRVADGGFFLAPWKKNNEHERSIKEECRATIRCYPMDMQDDLEGKTCFYSGEPADCIALFAKSY